MINTARDAVRLAADIGADNVLIHLDTYDMNIEEDDFVRPDGTDLAEHARQFIAEQLFLSSPAA